MDPSSSHSFSNVPLSQPLVISHYVSMVIAFLGCYPLLLTQQIRRHKRVVSFLSILFTLAGFITGQFIKTTNNFVSVVWRIVFLLLIFLVFIQFVLAIYRYSVQQQQQQQQQPQQRKNKTKITFLFSCYPRWFTKIPFWIDIVLGWLILIIAITYLVIAAQLFTSSCSTHECVLSASMGTGFLVYGTLTLLHLLSIIKIPRPSTPEYYEGIILVFWGFISLIMSSTPILGSEWRAINLGLLWFTGGLFSLSLSLQTWMPALRERNIVNSIVIFLTGRAIALSTSTDKDSYASTVHSMLGNILAISALARTVQIIFRKSPVDNLPRRMFQNINDSNFEDDEDDDDENGLANTTIARGAASQQKCKHKGLFASTTLISGVSVSVLSIGAGFLFIGANAGWIEHMKYYLPDPSTYVNVILAISFLWCVYVFGLCTLYIHLRRQNNVLYQYQELETTNIDTNELTITSERGRWSSSIPLGSLSTSAILASSPTEINTPLLQEQIRQEEEELEELEEHERSISPIPLHTITTNTTTTINSNENSNTNNIISSNEDSPKIIEKSMRPSEYRAKRRSLLVQSPFTTATSQASSQDHPHYYRPRPSSGIGVGGILPDELLYSDTKKTFRRSWRSSSGSSSIGYYSIDSTPSSPPPPLPGFERRKRNSTELHKFNEEVVYIGEDDIAKRN